MTADTASDRFRRINATFAARIAAVAPDGWSRPAPCSEWVARDVVRHLVDWVPSVIARAGVEFPAAPSVDDDPASAWSAVSDALQGALDDPQTAARRFDVGPPGEMSVEDAIDRLVTSDVLVHTWDLAVATGQDRAIDESMAAAMYDGMLPLDDMLRASGHFGARVQIADDADVQSKLIAFTGRNPLC
jgi:uncharacterized protein (TIGR03086 family)